MKYLKYFEAKSEDIYRVCLGVRGCCDCKNFKNYKSAIAYINKDKIKMHSYIINVPEIEYTFIFKYKIGEEIPDIFASYGPEITYSDDIYSDNLILWDALNPENIIKQRKPSENEFATVFVDKNEITIDFFKKYRNGGIEGCIKDIESRNKLSEFLISILENTDLNIDVIANLIDYKKLFNEVSKLPDSYKMINRLKQLPTIYSSLKSISVSEIDSASKMGEMGF